MIKSNAGRLGLLLIISLLLSGCTYTTLKDVSRYEDTLLRTNSEVSNVLSQKTKNEESAKLFESVIFNALFIKKTSSELADVFASSDFDIVLDYIAASQESEYNEKVSEVSVVEIDVPIADRNRFKEEAENATKENCEVYYFTDLKTGEVEQMCVVRLNRGDVITLHIIWYNGEINNVYYRFPSR